MVTVLIPTNKDFFLLREVDVVAEVEVAVLFHRFLLVVDLLAQGNAFAHKLESLQNPPTIGDCPLFRKL